MEVEDGWIIHLLRKVFIVKKLIWVALLCLIDAPAFAQPIDTTSEGFLKNMCENKKVSISCWKLGERFRTLDRNLKMALPWYEKACDMGLMDGCSYAGVIFAQRGTPYSKDFKKATKYFSLACEQKHDIACFNLGSIKYKEGRQKKAIKYYDMACEMGHQGGCARAAKLKK